MDGTKLFAEKMYIDLDYNDMKKRCEPKAEPF